ncbi:MAG: helix-turn-helix transcriptional regulator [Oscillospiraceae bacterium]|nr:helix-turn-helix transcriptional regulator [Oscillospiraceae bacterium]
MTLGERIQSLRKDAGLSQEELGEKLGVARQSVSKWESDTTIPELDKLIAMSKLFHISVGALLGLEESEGADRELTDRELAALEEIARKLAQTKAGEETPEEPPKKRRWPKVLAALAVLVAGVALMNRISSLENQLGNLQYNVSNIQNTVSREIGSISSQVRNILEEQNSVIAGKNYEVAGMDFLENTVTFVLTTTPREYKEGMKAVFSAVGLDFEAVEVPGVLGAGQTFTAELTCPLTDDITLSVGFVTDGAVVTQQLGRETYLLSQTQTDVMGNLAWSVGGTEDGVILHSLDADIWQTSGGSYKTREGWQEITIASGALRLWVNDELYWSQEFGDPVQLFTGTGIQIPTEELELKVGERVILSCLYTDTAGREKETFVDGFRVNKVGKPETLAPYDEDWENNYPWEKQE